MAITYQVAIGHDNEAGYADISRQPRCEGIRYARRIEVISGLVYEDGEAFADIVHCQGANQGLTATQFTALLSEYGVSSTVTADITITLPGDDRALDNWNAKAVRPRPRFRKGLYRDVTFRVKYLEAT